MWDISLAKYRPFLNTVHFNAVHFQRETMAEESKLQPTALLVALEETATENAKSDGRRSRYTNPRREMYISKVDTSQAHKLCLALPASIAEAGKWVDAQYENGKINRTEFHVLQAAVKRKEQNAISESLARVQKAWTEVKLPGEWRERDGGGFLDAWFVGPMNPNEVVYATEQALHTAMDAALKTLKYNTEQIHSLIKTLYLNRGGQTASWPLSHEQLDLLRQPPA